MTFRSYAQNLEDVMLWRALREATPGFYIDVGAADPDHDSVTRAFYERGWQGINIEPLGSHFETLATARARDINLRVALAEADGEATFFAIAGTGLSTLDRANADDARLRGMVVLETRVPTTTLAKICETHAARRDIHFLKIDVEGAEEGVLRGADFRRFRPWIVLVEATQPGTQTARYATWERVLRRARYRFAWFDGLNRFYVAAEHWPDLGQHFQVQPNVFDGYVTVTTTGEPDGAGMVAALERERAEAAARAAVAQRRAIGSAASRDPAERRAAEAEWREAAAQEALARAHERAAGLAARVHRAEQTAATLAASADEAARRLFAIRASRSWRLTEPVRRASGQARATFVTVIRLARHVPFHRRLVGLLRAASPRAYLWLERRYVHYARLTRPDAIPSTPSPAVPLAAGVDAAASVTAAVGIDDLSAAEAAVFEGLVAAGPGR